MKKISAYISALVIAIVTSVGLVTTPAQAINVFNNACSGNGSTSVCKGQKDDASKLIQSIIDAMLFLLGGIAALMIVIGGIRYVTSNGDASRTKGAKDTILYAVVGLIVAILAYAIVKFVTNNVK